MEKDSVLTFGVFENFFKNYMDQFRRDLDVRFEQSETNVINTLSKKIDEKVNEAIEELAYITKTGFDHVDERFEEINKRMDRAETKIDDLTTGMKEVKTFMQTSRLESASHRVRLQNLEARIAS